jgi:hypothetical protein
MREIILPFEMNLKLYFFLTVLFIFVFLSTELLNYWAIKTLGDLQSISRGLDPGVKM